MEVEELPCDQIDGQNIIYWEDIEHAFPGVQKVKNGRVVVKMMRDSNRTRITPHCIQHHAGVVLDVIISSDANQGKVVSAMEVARLAPIEDQVRTPADIPTTHLPANPRADAPVTTRRQTLLALGKPNQFYERPFPRLPIILPSAVRRVGDIVKPLPQHFKLYFLCECGAHTTKDGSMEEDRVHLADHAGYDLLRPMGLFKEFGSYILAVMKAIRAEMPSMAVAPLASSTVLQELRRIEVHTQEAISSLVDITIEYLDGMNKDHEASDLETTRNPFVLDGGDNYFPGRHGRHGLLSDFLDTEDQTLGNLYRTFTKDGDVYWVCPTHFQRNCDEDATRQFREVVEQNERSSFEERTGIVDIRLDDASKSIAFIDALNQVQNVQELAITFLWYAPQSIVRSLADAILKSNVASFVFSEVPDGHFPASDCNMHQRLDPLMLPLANGRMQSVSLLRTGGFFQQVSGFSAYNSMPALRKLRIAEVNDKHQFGLFLDVVRKCTALQEISTTFHKHHTHSWAVQCIEACPSLQELELHWFFSYVSVVFALLDHVKPLLTQQRDRRGLQSSLRYLKVENINHCVTAMRSKDGKMLVSTSTASTTKGLDPLLNIFGWAMGSVDLTHTSEDLTHICERNHFDFTPWMRSIEDQDGVSNLQSLSLDESKLAFENRLPLLKILERSQGLRTFELRLTRLDECFFADNVTWCLMNFGPRITKLDLRLQEGRVHPKITPLLSRRRLSRLVDIQVINKGQDNREIQWLINLVSADTGSSSHEIHALASLNLNGMHIRNASWKSLFKALDFKSLNRISLYNCSIRRSQWTILLDSLPTDGLMQGGYPIALMHLDISSYPPKQVFEGMKETMHAELAGRAPFAKLII
ncbi:hypothetical protein BGZ72_005794 [Mortierella alpina]|nr:hypothetical protein BGZ72_005794 [Mortierella alpina]